MAIFSLIIVLVLEQLKPLDYVRWVVTPLQRWAAYLERRFNAGSYRQGVFVWCVAVLPILLGAIALYFWLYWLSPLLAMLFNVLVLYLCMGYRHFGLQYSDIHLALRLGNLEHARALLAAWVGPFRAGSSGSHGDSLASETIQAGLVTAHRHVFAVILWFILLPGPIGPLLYRLAEQLAQRWQGREEPGGFGIFQRQAFRVLDWLPLRTTSAVFAIVGNFEDAVYCWRSQAKQWHDPALGIVLASGAGALGVRFGCSLTDSELSRFQSEVGGEPRFEAHLGVGELVRIEEMQNAVALIWRAVVVWLLLLFSLGLAHWVG